MPLTPSIQRYDHVTEKREINAAKKLNQLFTDSHLENEKLEENSKNESA